MAEYEQRRPGEMVEWATRAEANETVDRNVRYRQIREILAAAPEGLNAREIAHEMHRRGWTPTDERNFAAPRLTELMHAGEVSAEASKTCPFTKKKTAVYTLRKEEQNNDAEN